MFARATIDFGARERVVVSDRAVIKRAARATVLYMYITTMVLLLILK